MQGDNRIERFDVDWIRGSNAMVERDNKEITSEEVISSIGKTN